MKWISELVGLYVFDPSFYVSVIIGIILIILAIIFVRYYFKDSGIKHITPFVIFIVFLMLASYVLNFICKRRPFKALFNMIGMFFIIDYEIENLQGVIEPIYYLVKLLAICATFYIVIFRFFNILKKEDKIKKVKKSIDDYVILFSDGSLKEYITKHSTKMIDAYELNEDCYDGGSYFIAYDNDQKNISFYFSNKETLKDKKVAILINDIESSLFNEEGYHVVNF